MDALGIETRARSRSKTPAILLGENGDYEGGVKKGSKKIPTVSLIEEEEVVEVAASQSQRPKRQRKSAKVASDTSGEMESPKNSQQKTTVEIKTSQREVTNGSNKEKSDLSPPPAIITTTTSTITTNNVMLEAPENQSIFNNIFNVIKTSTPILSTSKRSKRISQEVKSNTSTSPTIDIKQHPAYKEYKEAGEYWNKFPKTDYTYSELSPHRRQLGNGVVNMPNMSRRSLEKYSQRVEHMIQNNPQEESFLRRKFLSNSFQKRSAELQYDSADEVDVSDLHRSLATRQQKQSNFFYSFYLLIVTAFSSAYSSAKQGVKKVLYYRTNQTPSRYTYTPIKHYGQSGSQRIFNAVQKFVLLCASKVYLLISTVLCLDTWLLYNRSANVVENKKRKRFLLALLILLPLLLFGALYLTDENEDIRHNTIASRIVSRTQNLYHKTYASLPSFDASLRDHLPDISLPRIQMPQWNFNIGWLFAPLISFGVAFREFIFGASQAREELKLSLDEAKFQMILKHIDTYIDNTIGEKLLSEDGKMKEVNDRLMLIISNHINDALNRYEFKLTSKDIDEIVLSVRNQLSDDLDSRDKLILGKLSLVSEETVKKISKLSSAPQKVELENQKVDLESIIAMILQSDKLFDVIDGRLRPLIDRLDSHDSELANIKLHVDRLKEEILQKFTENNNDFDQLKLNQKNFADELYKIKLENDATLQKFMLELDQSNSQYNSIDASVRKNILNILGFNSMKNDVGESMSENDIKNWISNTFVAKNYLEERLNSLELNSNKIFQLQLDKNAGILMEEVNDEIRKQMAIALAAKRDEISKINISGGLLTEADVLRIVRAVLAVYDADKTGLVDYALESAGGEIISTRCTENYRTRHAEISVFGIPIWYPSNTPRTVISPSIQPGECWAWTNFPGYLVVKLYNSIHVSGFTVEHIPQSLAPNNQIDSAPNNFTVWGLTGEFDKDPVLYGTYYYSNEKDASSLQYFAVQNKEITLPYQYVELRVESNHGNPRYTCLYRFRVHGDTMQ